MIGSRTRPSSPTTATNPVELLAAILRHEPIGPAALDDFTPEEFCSNAEHHGVLPLVADHLDRRAISGPLPSLLREHVRRQVAADLVREAELFDVLNALGRAGVTFLILKGAHLAYAWYQRPHHRPRLDTDLLIASAERSQVHGLLDRLGYRVPNHVGGDVMLHQAAYVKARDRQPRHIIDVHWRLANPHVFALLPTLEELSADAVAIPHLGPYARGMSATQALLFACVHRVAHHFDTARLIWLYDIHLLASALSASEWDLFLAAAARSQVSTVCRQSLTSAVRRFETNVPAYVFSETRVSATDREATAGYLAQRSRIQHMLSDLQALPSWRDRVQLLREHLFPSREYMREVYALSSRAPLPLLYARRVVRGARRWFERFPSD